MFKRIARLFRRPEAKPDPNEQFAEICRVWDSSRAFGMDWTPTRNGLLALRAERLRTEIARLKRNKKRWSHLQRELDQLEGSL